ncbi:sulfite exporter TauE/SafE family protein [Aliikangiella sp. G2MR2-5]|uniref:sulfite exporter TauE/SafE family protein n=1 Tax=Aliikangiella sp. G2MR2-5 TaxID=2788943 RepID=UPI0018A8D557|nr:sulfite exporter TauE/SafE family protein [Aliikangiella sp. G2MR2-5]
MFFSRVKNTGSRFFFMSSMLLIGIINIGLMPGSHALISDYSLFTLLGVAGAIFANSTGAGGGVVFIPMFNYLEFSEAQSIATSFGIQSFGMTAGAITWGLYYYKKGATACSSVAREPLVPIILPTAFMSIVGVWTVYGFDLSSPANLRDLFKTFSLLLGVMILIMAFFFRQESTRTQLFNKDYVALVLIGYFGGMITAWLSVGVGEILVVYLILNRFNVTMSVAAGVIVSALTVWAGVVEHFLLSDYASKEVVLFAGMGAVLGGMLAKHLVLWFSPFRLKVFFALCILVLAILS